MERRCANTAFDDRMVWYQFITMLEFTLSFDIAVPNRF
jgi:hypothetical protein